MSNNPSLSSIVAKSLLVITIMVVFWLAIASSLWGFSVATAGVHGRGEAKKQLQSAGYRISAYDHFFDLCASVQNDEASLDAQFDLLTTTSQTNIVEVNIAALKANRMRGINQYNADASKDYTLGQFQSSKLPYQLAALAYDKKGDPKTTCAL